MAEDRVYYWEMTEKLPAQSNRRRNRLGARVSRAVVWRQAVLREITMRQGLVGVCLIVAVTLLLADYRFQSVPDFAVGEIADRTIEAPQSFTVNDTEATSGKRQEALKMVPAVFDLDLRRNSRVELELHNDLEAGRRLLAEFVKSGGGSASQSNSETELIKRIKEALPRLDREGLVELLVKYEFDPELEGQMVLMLQQAMKPPGVAASRELLLLYSNRGIVLFNTVTDQDEVLQDWLSVRDLTQSRDLLRQSQYELTAVDAADKRPLIEFLETLVVPNVLFNEAETQNREQLALGEVAPVLIEIKRGKTIARAGDEITPQHLMILEALKDLERASQPVDRFVGIFLLVTFLMLALWHYFLRQRRQQTTEARLYLLLGVVLILNLAVTKALVALADLVSAGLALEFLQDPRQFYFAAPLVFGTILITLMVDFRMATVYALVFSVFVALMTGELLLMVYGFVGSLAAVHVLQHYREQSTIVSTGLTIGIVNILTVLALQFLSGFVWIGFGINSLAALLSGLFSAMLVLVLLPVLESLFAITTDIRLLELSNLNKPILRRLAVEAPGTYHHSIIVGTLAEAAAEAIGANPLLARVGAYYHDIGKLLKPEYFVENQIYMSNKHENLTPSMSSLILASHVKDGLALADEINLSSKVKDLIPQHHGTKLMTYFYRKAKQSAEEKGDEVTEEDYRYPGPKPRTREAAILMLADQVEAASRTLKDPTPRQIRSLIRRLIQATIEDRQFDECEIMTRDLDQITRAFERVITGIYHQRIEYPGFDFNSEIAQRSQYRRVQ